MEAFEGFTAMEGFLALTGLVGVPGMTGGESAGEGMSKCWRGRCMLRVTAAAAPTTLITFPVSFKLSLPETGGPSSGPEGLNSGYDWGSTKYSPSASTRHKTRSR